MLVFGSSGTSKPNVLLNLIKHQEPDNGKTYLNAKHPFESKYQLLINKREKRGIKQLKI